MSFLTERQQQVLDFIRAMVRRRGVAPTLAEIADEFGFRSTASAQKQVLYLERKGYLRRVPNQARGLVLVERKAAPGADEALSMVPLVGSVAAGSPIDTEVQDETVAVPPSLVRASDAFAVRVRGESMIEDGIHDDDLLILEPRTQAREGETVVALVDGEVTLKRFFREGAGVIRLQPSNSALEPLRISEDRVQVQGAVVALLRYYH